MAQEHWKRRQGKDKADLSELSPTASVRPASALMAQIEALQAELAAWRATAAVHRADYERERDRCDRLASDLREIAARMARPWWRRLAG
jgi:hypothetical protein